MDMLIIATIVAFTCLSALADGVTYDVPQPAVSQLTRADERDRVRAAMRPRATPARCAGMGMPHESGACVD